MATSVGEKSGLSNRTMGLDSSRRERRHGRQASASRHPSMTPNATPTFRLPLAPSIGMLTVRGSAPSLPATRPAPRSRRRRCRAPEIQSESIDSPRSSRAMTSPSPQSASSPPRRHGTIDVAPIAERAARGWYGIGRKARQYELGHTEGVGAPEYRADVERRTQVFEVRADTREIRGARRRQAPARAARGSPSRRAIRPHAPRARAPAC